MKEDSLFYFSSINEFILFYSELDIYNGWKIEEGLLNYRGKKVENRRYFKYLKNAFNQKGFFRKSVSVAEIISWLDTSELMNRLLINLRAKVNLDDYQTTEMYVEYMIRMSKRMRVDYVLKYKDNIVLIEFRTVNSFEKIRPTWDIKFRELLIYKELLGYYQPHLNIKLYAFISMFEVDSRGAKVEKNIKYNADQVAYLTEYCLRYLYEK